MPDTRTTREGIVFTVYVQPRASTNSVAGLHDNAVKIRLTAPPVDNAANTMCLRFLSRQLKIPPSRLEIASGHTHRKKTILVRYEENTDPEKSGRNIIERIESLLR